jgi:NADH:ubiquinone oxidoreductase subunit F (NADH-binding)
VGLCCRQPIVLERIAAGGAHEWGEYQRVGGGAALSAALRLGPQGVIRELKASELRGRGGAGFPTGVKWRVAREQIGGEKYVVANVDEGDPGAYIDRFIVEDDPFCLIEGLVIAAYAIGAAKGWIYVRAEYPNAVRMLSRALAEARDVGLLGPKVFESDFTFDVELVVGSGGYICGEETALLNAIEDKRPIVRPRPPFVAQRGLWGKPTVVNNAETLANVPWILRYGGPAYASTGVPGSRGTKVVSLNSLFRRPGLYEIDFGMPLRELVDSVGGGLRDGELKGLIIGGPLAGVVSTTQLETRFGFEELQAIGACVGHGGVIAFDEHTSVAELVHHVFSFAAYESCGNCTPCRLGAPRVEQIFRHIVAGERGTAAEEAEWRDIVAALKYASLCGLGVGLAEFAESILTKYARELRQCFE